VVDDHQVSSYSVHLYSAIDQQPIAGVKVELVGLADTPNLFTNASTGDRFTMVYTDNDGHAWFGAMPIIIPSLLHDGEGYPAWFYLDFPEGSPYQSRLMKVHSQPPNHDLNFEIYVGYTSSAKAWEIYR
ncbi:hypothetical protein K8I31_12080, partial [bacterium]|nr:hypothetical protein [bacterium]